MNDDGMVTQSRCVESHTTTVGATSLQVDVHGDGTVWVSLGGVWVTYPDLADAFKFARKHGIRE
jgi:hypothetical protein